MFAELDDAQAAQSKEASTFRRARRTSRKESDHFDSSRGAGGVRNRLSKEDVARQAREESELTGE
jgi:hypothetical protein